MTNPGDHIFCLNQNLGKRAIIYSNKNCDGYYHILYRHCYSLHELIASTKNNNIEGIFIPLPFKLDSKEHW